MKLKRLLTCLLVPVLVLSMFLGSALAEETAAAVPEGERSMVGTLFDSLDPETGIHIQYEVSILGYNTIYDFQAKGLQSYERYYLREFGSSDADSLQIFTDNRLYSVKKSDMSGFYIDAPEVVESGAMLCPIYSALYNVERETALEKTEYEIDGVVYQAEKFPAQSELSVDQIFCFDEAGNLAYVVNCASESLGIGEYAYKVTGMDQEVDETLFDVSGYEVQDYKTMLEELQQQLDALNAG